MRFFHFGGFSSVLLNLTIVIDETLSVVAAAAASTDWQLAAFFN